MFSQQSLDELTEEVREYATELTQSDAAIADEVLLARTELESALESDTPTSHIQNAYDHLQLAKQIDQVNKNHQETLTSYLDAVKQHLQ